MQILTEPKNALVKQYQRLFDMEDVKLSFQQDALDEVVEMAMTKKTGARSLRAILEDVMLDIMFQIPSQSGVQECIITKEVILKREPPLCITGEEKKPA